MRVERLRRVQVAVAVNAAEPQELRCRESGNEPKDFLLRAGLEPRLEADEVPHLRGAIFLPQLDDGVRLAPGLRVGESNRLHGTESQRLDTALRHLLDRQASLEVRHF